MREARCANTGLVACYKSRLLSLKRTSLGRALQLDISADSQQLEVYSCNDQER